jgi:hypothetical protein
MIWYEDLQQFITKDNYMEILPTGAMSMEEKLNALVRLLLYFGVIMALVRADYRYLFFGIIAAMISIVVYSVETRQRQNAERFLQERKLAIVDNKVCTRTTVENPFMNPNIIDITENPRHPQACPIDNEMVKEKVADNYNARMFRDAGDLYDRNTGQRQFYTVPATTIPNDQTGFAKWVYEPPTTCKEQGTKCDGFVYREYSP